MVACEAGECRAERGADTDEGSDKTLTEIETPGAAGEVGNNERHHHAEDCGSHAIEQLHDDQQLRILSPRQTEDRERAARRSR